MGVSRAELKSFTLKEVRKYPKSDRISMGFIPTDTILKLKPKKTTLL